MNTKGTGFLFDRIEKFLTGHADAYPAHDRLKDAPVLLQSPSFVGHWPSCGKIWQANIGSCVWTNGIKANAAIYHSVRGHGEVLIADLLGYLQALRAQAAPTNPDPLNPVWVTDDGLSPENAADVAAALGFVLESAYPGPASDPAWPYGDDKAAEDRLNRDPGSDIGGKSYDGRGLKWHSITGDFYTEVSGLMLRGIPIGGALNADSLQADPGSSIVQTLPRTGQNHFIPIIDVSDPSWDRIGQSWFRPGVCVYGDQTADAVRGSVRIRKGVLPLVLSNVLALDMVPLPVGKAA